MPFQIPKATHPWRQYKNRQSYQEEEKDNGLKPIRVFLSELVTGWDAVEITTTAYQGEGRYKLTELSSRKVAAWLAGILRRNYA